MGRMESGCQLLPFFDQRPEIRGGGREGVPRSRRTRAVQADAAAGQALCEGAKDPIARAHGKRRIRTSSADAPDVAKVFAKAGDLGGTEQSHGVDLGRPEIRRCSATWLDCGENLALRRCASSDRSLCIGPQRRKPTGWLVSLRWQES